MAKLVITNGDSVAGLLIQAFKDPSVTVLPWRDVLHFGPLTWTETLEDFSLPRLKPLSGLGIPIGEIAHNLMERDQLIARHQDFDRIEIWLEHDLYDQLQLVQIIDTFSRILKRCEGVALVQADDFLGHETPQTIGRFADCAELVCDEMAATAQKIWRALTASTPRDVANLVENGFRDSFPFMSAALLRLLEELPGADGLSRTQRTALLRLQDGPLSAGGTFCAVQNTEPASFMGDTMFFQALDELIFTAEPAIRFAVATDVQACRDSPRELLHLTEFGQELIEGSDFLASNSIDRWWGGTHLSSSNIWRWAFELGKLVSPIEQR